VEEIYDENSQLPLSVSIDRLIVVHLKLHGVSAVGEERIPPSLRRSRARVEFMF
jgi:hypothetical protein